MILQPYIYTLLFGVSMAYEGEKPEVTTQQTTQASVVPARKSYSGEVIQKKIHTTVKALIKHNKEDRALKFLRPYKESTCASLGTNYVKYSTISHFIEHCLLKRKYPELNTLISYFPRTAEAAFSNLAIDATADEDMFLFSKLIEILSPYKLIVHSCYFKGIETSLFFGYNNIFYSHWYKSYPLLTADDREELMFDCIQANDLTRFKFILNYGCPYPETLDLCLIHAAYLGRTKLTEHLVNSHEISDNALKLAGNYWAVTLKHSEISDLLSKKLAHTDLTPEIEQCSLFNFADIPCSAFLRYHNDIVAIEHNNASYLFKIIFHLGIEPFYPPMIRIHDEDEGTAVMGLHKLNFTLPYLTLKDSLFYEATSKDESLTDSIYEDMTMIGNVNYPIKVFLELKLLRDITPLPSPIWKLFSMSDTYKVYQKPL